MLDGAGAVRLGRPILEGQEHRRHAAAAYSAAHADGDGDRHRGDDRYRRRPRLRAQLEPAGSIRDKANRYARAAKAAGRKTPLNDVTVARYVYLADSRR